MTEQEHPRTEAALTQPGRDMVAWQAGINGFDRAYWEKRVREVEEAALTEGRQQAVRAIIDAGAKDRCEPPCITFVNGHVGIERAGLNASESPPTGCTCGADYGSASCPVHDASEPHRDYAGRTCTTGLMHSHGDASESPRRFAALMETDDLARDRFGDAPRTLLVPGVCQKAAEDAYRMGLEDGRALGAGRAVQDDGLPTAARDFVEWWDQLETFDSNDDAYSLISKTDQKILEDFRDQFLHAAAPLHDPQEPER